MGWSWKGAARGVLGNIAERRKEKKDLAKELMLAKAKQSGGAQSSLGKLMQDMFGASGETGYSSDQWRQAQEMMKGTSHAPVGSPSMNPNEIATTIQTVMEAIDQISKPKNKTVAPSIPPGSSGGIIPSGDSVVGTFQGGKFVPKFGNRGMM